MIYKYEITGRIYESRYVLIKTKEYVKPYFNTCDSFRRFLSESKIRHKRKIIKDSEYDLLIPKSQVDNFKNFFCEAKEKYFLAQQMEKQEKKKRRRRSRYEKNKMARINGMEQSKKPLFSPFKEGVYCPICDLYHHPSNYLMSQKWSLKTKWLANLITHYRHEHNNAYHEKWCIESAYQRWKYDLYEYNDVYEFMAAHEEEHDAEKEKANENAKIVIAEKAKHYLLAHNIGLKEFMTLNNTNEDTLIKLRKIIGKRKGKKLYH